jgi:sialidase-1
VVFSHPNLHCGMPSIIRDSDGCFLCAFRQAPDRRVLGRKSVHHCDTNSYIMISRSSDGIRWQYPELVFAHPLGGCQDPCLFSTSNGTLLCSSYGYTLVEEGFQPARDQLHYGNYHFFGGFLLRLESESNNWNMLTTPQLENNRMLDYQNRPYPAFNRGSFMQHPESGTLYWAATRHISAAPPRGAVDLFSSNDDGITWSFEAVIAEDEAVGFNETSLVITPDNKLVAYLRTFSAEDCLYLSEANLDQKHLRFELRETSCKGHPYHPLLLDDGRIFLTYGIRGEVNQIRARVLNPPDFNPDAAEEFVVRAGGASWDIGYPWSALSESGEIIVVYYWHENENPPHIAWSRVSL